MAKDSTINLLKLHEGNIPYIYNDDDSTIPRKRISAAGGNLTCGVGFNLQTMNIPQPVINYWLSWLLDNIYIPVLLKIFPNFNSFSQNRQDALIDMIYNLGPSRFGEFENMIDDIKKYNWDGAAHEALNSSWASQVGQRSIDVANLLKNG